MTLSKEIVLRPRFTIQLHQNKSTVLKAFEDIKLTQKEFIITQIDEHVFIKFPKNKQHFWTPQLHLEINANTTKSSTLHGVFGPNPTVWTLFMFLHFSVATSFIGVAIWAYTNWALKQEYYMQFLIGFLLIVSWFVLYFAGRIGKASSKNEMIALYNFMNSVIMPFSP